MDNIATRNRAIKATLEQAFGRGKVRVRGSRGTAYGWVRVNIDHTPLSGDVAAELRGKCMQLLKAAKCCPDYYDSADYGSGHQINIQFNETPYRTTMTMSDGTTAGLRYDNSEWEPYQA